MIWKKTSYTGWGRVHKATGRLARPERISALEALSLSPAFGNLRSYGDACLNSEGDAIDMTRLDRMLGFDPETGILEVEAGCTIGDIARVFAPKGWLPAVMPGTGFATVGGCIAHDVHGKNHHGAGSFGHHLLSFKLRTQDKVLDVTPETDAALWNATLGGLGQTGIIQSAKLQLMACKGDTMSVTERRMDNLDMFLDALDASGSTYTVGWVDATAKGDALGRGILEEGETQYGLVPPAKRARSIMFDAPRFALSPPVVRTFNALYLRRVPAAGRTSVKPISEFFFPLDKINAWNRLYGKSGFLQFQCVLPIDAREVLRSMLDKIAYAGSASPLAVLKRMGPAGSGLMSFPMQGYTLAVDFPNRGRAPRLIGELEELAANAGGRVYLAKDATLQPKTLEKMYPQRAEFAQIAASMDPDGALQTDQTRRLKVRNLA